MAVFGGYEVVHELYRHGLGSVSRARSTEGDPEPKYVVKTFQPPMRLTAQEDVKTSVKEFLDAVRVQQDVAAAGSKHWAPIYEAGAVGRSGYYVTAFYPRTAQKLISGRVKLTPGALHAILAAAVEGLLELQRSANRAHGNLKPSNVLIEGEGEMEKSPILLTDLCPRQQLAGEAAVAEARDLEDVGGLICQLVMHRLFRGSQSWPIPKSPEWARLGAKGEAWRELCNRLLNPEGNDGLTLEGLATKLNKFRARRRPVSLKKGLGVMVLLIGGAGAYLGYEYTRHQSTWRALCREYAEWVGGFQAEMHADPDRLRRFQRDPYLGPVAALLDEDSGKAEALDPRKIAGDEKANLAELGEKPPISLGAARRARRAVEALQKAQAALSAEQWPLLKALSDRAALYRQRGWNAAADGLIRLVKATEPGAGKHPAIGIDALLKLQTPLGAEMAEIEEKWQGVAQTEKAIRSKAPGDKVLMQLAELGRTMDRPQGQTPGAQPLTELKAKVTELSELAGQIQGVLQMDWEQRVNRERFAAEGAIYQRPAPLTIADLRDWLREAQDYYRYTPGGAEAKAIARAVESAKAQLAQFKKEAPVGPEQGARAARLEKQLAAAEQQAAQFAARGWVQKDRRSGAVEKGAAEMLATLAEITTATAQGPALLRDLWNATNDKAQIKVKARAEIYSSRVAQEQCIRLTVTPDRDCYLLILLRDASGAISVLVPNVQLDLTPLAVKDHAWILDGANQKFEMPVMAPFGTTRFKVVATSRPLTFPGAKLSPESGFYENVTHLAIRDEPREVESLQALFAPADWAVTETEIVTKAPAGQ